MRLGQSEAADHLSARHARQVTLLLLLGAEGEDRIHAERGLHRDEAADPRVTALELLADEAVGDGVEARAVVAADRGAEQPLAREPWNQLARKAMLLEAALDDRQHLPIHDP